MNNVVTAFSTIAFILLLSGFVLQILLLFKNKKNIENICNILILGSSLLLFLFFVLRSIQISFFALTGSYESLVFYSAVLTLFTFIYSKQTKFKGSRNIQMICVFFAILLLAIASSPLISKDAIAPIPALRSYWLMLHVSFTFIGETFFVISFAAAVLTLITRDKEKQKSYDFITYKTIMIGYPIFTAGALLFGAIWAQGAWGRWWGWDPKETWALITWLIYTLYLHMRFIMKKSKRVTAIIAVIGFLSTLFTFFGVNYLLPSLHSYL